ncbi:PLDc N-terminal domain-containing protein [Candidatus Saccharibacteria bacterium]|nr:PLDc N-terminal domain-containing protein [Candidatus Saccharibacteria bacterium]
MKRSTLTKLSVLTGSLAVFAPIAAHAATYTSDYSADTASTGAAAGVGIFLIIWMLFWLAISIFFLVFWILMLMDVVKRTNWKQESDKTLWLILVILLGGLGAVIYYFAVKRELDKKPAAAGVTPPTEPQK